jgi:hypothetical protein
MISASQITSDYESDTASYMAAHPRLPIATLAQRTNTDLNMSVLKRYLPNITEIRSVAAQTVVYTLDPQTVTWDKANVEGTMFVCQQGGQDTLGCIFILNRKATDNLILDLRDVKEIEPKDELLIFAMGDKDGGDGPPKVLGLFIHADEDSTRTTNTQLIQELWGKVREARIDPRESSGQAQLQGGGVGLAMQAMGGRQVSLDELFGR